MILYVHFNNETGEMKMLQIPRDTMVTTDRSVSGNYRINNIAKTQAADGNSMNMAALCTLVSEYVPAADRWLYDDPPGNACAAGRHLRRH